LEDSFYALSLENTGLEQLKVVDTSSRFLDENLMILELEGDNLLAIDVCTARSTLSIHWSLDTTIITFL
jgi:hypothetical protein